MSKDNENSPKPYNKQELHKWIAIYCCYQPFHITKNNGLFMGQN